MSASRFEIGEREFLLDGMPHRILSGAIHYFRVHPDHWADRIRKARLMGLNAVETYVAWNAHEPRRGQWDATGWNDLGRFLDLVAAEGLRAIVRPGPYICAEWHNGGLPTWLTGVPGIRLRSSDPLYLAEASAYLERVYEIVAPRQLDRGGSVVLVQIENEYGAYGSDHDYLAELVRVTRTAGITVPLTTVDQPAPQMLRDGSIPGLHATASFGSQPARRLAALRAHQTDGPLMCMEFWDGWFDSWGGRHHTARVADAAADLDAILGAGASVNVYMFHGGTNFGLTSGANDKGRYAPIVTSYDYGAPLDEAGNPTDLYFALRDAIARHAPVPAEVPARAVPAPAFEVALDSLGDWRPAERGAGPFEAPPSFDALGFDGALVRYEAELPGQAGVLAFDEVRDRAHVEVDGVRVGAIARTDFGRAIALPAGRRVEVLVEDEGRVNYAERLGEAKGLIGAARFDGAPLTGWHATPIDVPRLGDALADVPATPVTAPLAGPVALRGEFDLDDPADLFLDTTDWGRGFAYVNGFLLGRYARRGPQRTLYVPAPLLHRGRNTVTIIELDHVLDVRARFVPAPLLGHLEE